MRCWWCTGRSSATAATPARATGASTRSCAPAIPAAASATSRQCTRWRARRDCCCGTRWRCRPTTAAWCGSGTHDGSRCNAVRHLPLPRGPDARPRCDVDLRRSGARMEVEESPRTLQAGSLDVDLAARRAFTAGRELELEPLVFDLLAVLAARPNEVVGKDALWQQVWQARPVSDSVIPHAVSKLRRALDAAGAPEQVVAVHGRG